MRTFVALRPPPQVRALLLAMTGGVPGARWQDDAQLHLTLAFLGEVPQDAEECLASALGSISMGPFTIDLRGVGHFERKGAPSALWAGVAPDPSLSELHTRVVRACRRAGVTPDAKAFRPHVTLARLPRHAGSPAPWLAAHGLFAAGPWQVNAFALYQSHLRPGGSIYEPLVDFRLAP